MRRTFDGDRGFSLIEVALVLGIASFVLVALVGLTGTALNTTKESAMNLEAASVAGQIATRWNSIVEWNSDPNVSPKAGRPNGFPFAIDPPIKGVELKGEDIFVDKSGLTTTTVTDQTFNLKYAVFRSADNPLLVRLYLRLSWPAVPAGAGGSTDTRGNYEMVAGALLKKDF